MNYEQVIRARIERRTCSRREWHALRRFEWKRARALELGLPFTSYELAAVMMTEDMRRAAEALLPMLQRFVRSMPGAVRRKP